MAKYFKDYFWKNGFPEGKGILMPESSIPNEDCFKIVMDPYRKRVSIEKYSKENFDSIVYDSILLNFRQLSPVDQMAWEKTIIQKESAQIRSLIRNQDDRIVYIEQYTFEKDLCRLCQVFSPQNILLSIHQLYYEVLGDPFNGAIVYDSHHRPVMMKRYEWDHITRQFTQLLEESWDLEKHPLRAVLHGQNTF